MGHYDRFSGSYSVRLSRQETRRVIADKGEVCCGQYVIDKKDIGYEANTNKQPVANLVCVHIFLRFLISHL